MNACALHTLLQTTEASKKSIKLHDASEALRRLKQKTMQPPENTYSLTLMKPSEAWGSGFWVQVLGFLGILEFRF